MSGKLIMKRKLDKNEKPTINNNVHVDECSTSSSTLNENKRPKENDDAESKRIRCDTPPSEPDDIDLSSVQVNRQNRHLLEAIQLKMLELESELDAFEHDVEAHEEDFHYNRQTNQMLEQDAEALGFAMCAQETMQFLQREGIPSESLLYTRLRNALVGRSQTDRAFNV